MPPAKAPRWCRFASGSPSWTAHPVAHARCGYHAAECQSARHHRGSLRIEHPTRAAEHFLNMIKGAHNFRLLVGCAAPADQDTVEEHVREVVMLFMRTYRPDA
ncbi:TetR family transcriptional regulator [Pseudomonas syringae pv. apii]|uniref:TetR family transcriptional regulator n=1 Tax=Pseudomonas syringae pv. apii TaxID=81036 RepID=A0A3M3R512_9PSED|nr:TetR family transcriptional regulator [Pseudomonas syringae pv. apii]